MHDRKSSNETLHRKRYFCLSFDFEFEYENDKVFFAYSVPYTYSKMMNMLKTLSTPLRALSYGKDYFYESFR